MATHTPKEVIDKVAGIGAAKADLSSGRNGTYARFAPLPYSPAYISLSEECYQ